VELVRRAVILLNAFPAMDGISRMLSPKNIMTGKQNLDYNSCKVEFGSYVLVFKDNDPTNTTKSCSTGAIALNPAGNTEGDYHFMSPTTGKRLARRQWTAVPMPDSVIAAVESRAHDEKQPLIEGGCPRFEWRPNVLITDDIANDKEPTQPLLREPVDALNLLADLADVADPLLTDNAADDLSVVPPVNFGVGHPNHEDASIDSGPNRDLPDDISEATLGDAEVPALVQPNPPHGQDEVSDNESEEDVISE